VTVNVPVNLDPLLLEILACPCPQHAPLRQDALAGAPVLVCTSCNLAFPIRDDIPVMLLDEATPFVADAAGSDDPAADADAAASAGPVADAVAKPVGP
jgi:uncharacterized protein YbaR (Trm112 family)